MARIASLLDPYFDKGTPQSIREIEAEDWADALADYPRWAIQRAARWWKSEENKDRRKRPLEGDIVARVRVEMDAVIAAMRMASCKGYLVASDEKPDRVSPEAAKEILEKAGFAPKRPDVIKESKDDN